MKAMSEIKFNTTHDHKMYLQVYIANGDVRQAAINAIQDGLFMAGIDLETAMTVMSNIKSEYNQ